MDNRFVVRFTHPDGTNAYVNAHGELSSRSGPKFFTLATATTAVARWTEMGWNGICVVAIPLDS